MTGVPGGQSGGAAKLQRTVGAGQYFTLAFGTIVGVGWIVVLGSWLDHAGPFGAIVAFALGGAIIMLVGLCYGELAAMFPVSGGEFAYAYEIFGLRSAFVVGWALLLNYMAAVAYVSLSAAWIVDALVPGIRGPALYTFRGGEVRLGSLIVASTVTAGLTIINYRGVKSATRLQDWLTYGKIVIALVFLTAGFVAGSAANLEPPFKVDASGSIIPGILGVLVVTPWFYGGFNTVPQAMEERSTGVSLQSVGRMILLSIGVGIAFYCLVILSASMVVPWKELVAMDLPAATAFQVAFRSSFLAKVVLLSGLFGVITVGNGTAFAGTRLLFALSRAQIITPRFAAVHPRFGSPHRAVLFVGGIAAIALLLGRNGILPIISVGGTCLSLGYATVCLGTLRLRRKDPARHRPFGVPGGAVTAAVASVSAVALLGLSLYEPVAANKGIPLELWTLIAWAAIGLGVWAAARSNRSRIPESARRELIVNAADSSLQ